MADFKEHLMTQPVEVSVTFTGADRPEDCALTEERFSEWLANNGGALRDHLIAAGNDWIETHLEIDGHLDTEGFLCPWCDERTYRGVCVNCDTE